MKRGGFLARKTPLKSGGFLRRGTAIRARGKSETSVIKEEIQSLLRQIVILRDGGCILRYLPSHHCTGFTKAGDLILQADHLVTRANSATFADYRLVVCVCKGAHGWKSLGSNRNKAQYDALVKTLIEPERAALWEAAEHDSWRPQRMGAYDWQKEAAFLRTKLQTLQLGSAPPILADT